VRCPNSYHGADRTMLMIPPSQVTLSALAFTAATTLSVWWAGSSADLSRLIANPAFPLLVPSDALAPGIIPGSSPGVPRAAPILAIDLESQGCVYLHTDITPPPQHH
jgi:hypothetical protein